MQKAVGIGVDLLVALDAIYVEAHADELPILGLMRRGLESGALNKDSYE
jgi:hypothetical protein